MAKRKKSNSFALALGSNSQSSVFAMSVVPAHATTPYTAYMLIYCIYTGHS